VAAQPVEDVAEAIAQAVKHSILKSGLRQQKRQCATLADWRLRYGDALLAPFGRVVDT